MRARLQGLAPRGEFKSPYDIKARVTRNQARGPSNNEQIKADTSVLDGILAAERADKYAAKADDRRAEINMALKEYDNNLRKDLERFRFENLGGDEELKIKKAQLKSSLAQLALYASDRVRDLMDEKSETNRLVRAREEGENLEERAEQYLAELNQLVNAEVLRAITTAVDQDIQDYIERKLPSAQDELSPSQQEELIRMFGSRFRPNIEAQYEDRRKEVMRMQTKAIELKSEGLTEQAANQLILELDSQLKPLRRMASNFFDEAQDDNLNRQAPKSTPPPAPTTSPKSEPPPRPANNPLGANAPTGTVGKKVNPLDGITPDEGTPDEGETGNPLSSVPARPTTKRRRGRSSNPPQKTDGNFMQRLFGYTTPNSVKDRIALQKEAEKYGIPFTTPAEVQRKLAEINAQREANLGPDARRSGTPLEASAIQTVAEQTPPPPPTEEPLQAAPAQPPKTEQAPSLPNVDLLSRVSSRENGPMFSVYDSPPPTRMMPVSQYGNAERQAMSKFQGQNVIPVNAVQTLPDGTTAGFRALAIDSNGDGSPDKILDIIDQPRFTNPKGQRIDQQFNSPEMLSALRGSLGI